MSSWISAAMRRRWAWIACFGLATATAHAESRAHAVRRHGAVTIDGRLDEPQWQRAPRQGEFTQRFPKDGARAQLPTRFAVLYDDEAVYVGVWADDPDPTRIRRLLTRRDVESPSDAVLVGIDSYHDKRTAYVFQLNAAGVQRDMMLSDDENEDWSWDAVWTGDATVTDHGWTAEFRIPLSQLRFADLPRQEWGFQVVRTVSRTSEQTAWSPWPRSGSQNVSKFGVVDGIERISQGRRLELLPYATAGLQSQPVDDGDPLNDPLSATGNLGLDLKYGLGPAFTLSAAINPDFGQVEADPSQVNLSGDELFFAEKRPFFIEGADLFKLPIGVTNGGVEGAFYSRRIGAPPPAGADGDYSRSPDFVTIYNAAKLTGKTSSGWSVGVLDAVTAEEAATVIVDGMTERPVVSPLTNYAVARVKRDLRGGKTSVGASATAVHRKLDGTGLEGLLHDQAYSAGAQFEHRWASNAWYASLGLVGSHVRGSREAIANTQASQVHLFQRPDADHLTFDPDRESLTGLGFGWLVGRLGETKRWRYGIGGDLRTAGLELNDVGFLRNADQMITFYMIEVHDESPGDHVLNYTFNSDVFTVSEVGHRLDFVGLEGNGQVQAVNYWTINYGFNARTGGWSKGALRGGPSLRVDPAIDTSIFINTDSRKSVQVGFGGYLGEVPASKTVSGGADVGLTIQARSNIDLFLGPSWSRRDDALQFVDAPLDGDGAPHYVFARIDQTTLGMTMRLNWTFSPRLSLQAYAQPFIATGRYREYKDIDDPGAARFEDRFTRLEGNALSEMDGTLTATNGGTFQFARPDFRFTELRSNVVVRWEYRPGSSLFAIWSHGQTGVTDDGRFGLGRGLRDLADTAGEDLVMVKLNYWLGL